MGFSLQDLTLPGLAMDAYKKFYSDPAKKQTDALAAAQQQSLAAAEQNRQFQMQGLNRAQSFYGPARDVLSQMLGGTPTGGFGQTNVPYTPIGPPTVSAGAPATPPQGAPKQSLPAQVANGPGVAVGNAVSYLPRKIASFFG
jgi:hypothetical protein